MVPPYGRERPGSSPGVCLRQGAANAAVPNRGRDSGAVSRLNGRMDIPVEPLLQPSVLVVRPESQTTPLVFASPHSGRCYPAEFVAASRLDRSGLRRSEDCFVDDLFAEAREEPKVRRAENCPDRTHDGSQRDVLSGEADVGFDVGGDGVGAVGDEIAVRDECGDGAGELLGAGGDGHDEEESEGKGNARMQSWGEGLSACGGGAGGMAQGAN